MVESTEHGLILQFDMPVRKSAADERKELDLSGVDKDDLILTRSDGAVPDTTVEVQQETHQMGWFVAQVFLGHPTHPLSYLGLTEGDTMRELDNNQIGNLVKVYSTDDDWFYYSASEHRNGDIYIWGTPGDFLECAKKRVEEDDNSEEVDDRLLAWESHPHINQGVRGALAEYDSYYKDEFTDPP